MSVIWRLEAWRILLQNGSLNPKVGMVLGLTTFNILSIYLLLYYSGMRYSTISESNSGHFAAAGESQLQTGIMGCCLPVYNYLFQNVSIFMKNTISVFTYFYEGMIGILWFEVFLGENPGAVQSQGRDLLPRSLPPPPPPTSSSSRGPHLHLPCQLTEVNVLSILG